MSHPKGLLMSSTGQIVTFLIDSRRFGLPLHQVDSALRAVEPTPLPGAPPIIMGIFLLRGTVIPLFNTRRRMGFPEREVGINDEFLIARDGKKTMALLVDAVAGVVEYPPSALIPPHDILPNLNLVAGVLQLQDGLLLINDLCAFLSLEESRALENALGAAHGR